MGTSSSYKGKIDSIELANDQVLSKQVSWRAAKTNFSRYVNGNGGSIKKTGSDYVKASGSWRGLLLSSKAGMSGAIRLATLLNEINDKGFINTLSELEINFIGKGINEILSLVTNYIVDTSDTKEDVIARDATIEALMIIYEYVENNDLDIELINHIDESLMNEVLCAYIETYITGRILNDLGYSIEKYARNAQSAIDIEVEMRDYISSVVRTTFNNDEIKKAIFKKGTIADGINKLYEKCYKVLEDMG